MTKPGAADRHGRSEDHPFVGLPEYPCDGRGGEHVERAEHADVVELGDQTLAETTVIVVCEAGSSRPIAVMTVVALQQVADGDDERGRRMPTGPHRIVPRRSPGCRRRPCLERTGTSIRRDARSGS